MHRGLASQHRTKERPRAAGTSWPGARAPQAARPGRVTSSRSALSTGGHHGSRRHTRHVFGDEASAPGVGRARERGRDRSARAWASTVIAVDRYAGAPAMQVAHRSHVIAMTDAAALRRVILAERPDFVVPELEAIATPTLVELESEGVCGHPDGAGGAPHDGSRRYPAARGGEAGPPHVALRVCVGAATSTARRSGRWACRAWSSPS